MPFYPYQAEGNALAGFHNTTNGTCLFCRSNEYSFTSMKTVLYGNNKTILVYNDYGTQFFKNDCLNRNWKLYISLSFHLYSKHFTGKYVTELKTDFKYNHNSKKL